MFQTTITTETQQKHKKEQSYKQRRREVSEQTARRIKTEMHGQIRGMKTTKKDPKGSLRHRLFRGGQPSK